MGDGKPIYHERLGDWKISAFDFAKNKGYFCKKFFVKDSLGL